MRTLRKLLIFLALTAIISVVGAVTITDQASLKNTGPNIGFKNKGTIQASDLYATDDAKVGDDLQVVGDLAVTTADKLTVGGVIVPQEVSLVVPIAASSVDQYCFIADAAYNITGIREIHAVAGNDASPVNVTVRICDDTEAPASGLNVSTAVMSLKSSAATLQSATLNSSNVAVAANDMVALDFTGTLTTLAGGCVQIDMKRV